jgi:hypothetical protein
VSPSLQEPGGQQFRTGRWRQNRSGAISQNAAALNAKMPMPIHTIVMVMAASRRSLIKRGQRQGVPSKELAMACRQSQEPPT